MGYVFTGHFPGLGIGTICAMIGVGRVVALYNYIFRERTLAAMGLTETAAE